jgi:hypothetical protein
VDGYIPLGLGYQAVLSPEGEAGSTSWTKPPIETSIDSDPRPGFLCSVHLSTQLVRGARQGFGIKPWLACHCSQSALGGKVNEPNDFLDLL